MEPESSLPLTQQPSTAPYPEPHQSSPRHSFSVKVYFNNILPHKHRSYKWSLSFRFPHQHSLFTSPLSRTFRLPRSTHSSWFDQICCL